MPSADGKNITLVSPEHFLGRAHPLPPEHFQPVHRFLCIILGEGQNILRHKSHSADCEFPYSGRRVVVFVISFSKECCSWDLDVPTQHASFAGVISHEERFSSLILGKTMLTILMCIRSVFI